MPGGRLAALLPAPSRPLRSERDLPVRRHKARIVEKVLENRVTLICADTGSGKSSQVPQMLLEEGLCPILCTQPRRLAVVAVAKRVAQECECVLGTDVGYQIGQYNCSTTSSKVVFKTAGILFEELRTNGVGALARYKVVILDEVHERSVESDLVLTCLKQLLRTTSAKLVLMSATADLLKYTEYFNEIVRDQGVQKIAIPSVANQLQNVMCNTKVVHLEQVVKLLGDDPRHVDLLRSMNESFEPAEQGIDIGNPTQNLMKDLIVHIHRSEPDLSKNVLVFLPTYRALEQQWLLLKFSREAFQVFVLHSSIDIDHSIRAMEACPKHQRKVILATNVAESSITIPGVAFVIDACRSLEICWDSNLKKHHPRIVWVSESQATQRKGRTGRTCDGVVYRMVPRTHILKFEKFETPAMQLLSLRKQVLMVLCSSSKALNDPVGLLKKCINPPRHETVQDALEALEDLNAIQCNGKGKHQPTLYGHLLVALPLSLEAAMLVIRGGQLGYAREATVLGAILDSTPNPIIKPFGDQYQYVANLESYYKAADAEEGQSQAPHTAVMLANMHAFEFWQLNFKNKQRVDLLVQQARSLWLHSRGLSNSDQEGMELDWCTQHKLSLSSLLSVAETVDSIMEALHRFRPKFLLNNVSGPLSYTSVYYFYHKCCGPQSLSQFDETSDDTSDEWNGGDYGNDDPSQFDDTSPAWSDWSVQKSDQNISNGCNGNGQVHAGHQGNGYGQPSANGNGVGQVVGSSQQHDNGHRNGGDAVNGSKQSEEPSICNSIPYTQSGTFHTLEDEQILSALLVEIQKGQQQSLVAEVVQETMGDQLSNEVPFCSYFRKGMCNKGSSCLYSHSPTAKPVVCRFFMSPSGCRYGDSCRYLHEDPFRYVLPQDTEPISFDEQSPTPQSMLDLLPALNKDEFLLLFGEGDFSFAESLSKFVDPRQIFATSLDQEETFLRDPNLSQKLRKLEMIQMPLMWNVDVTSLVTCSRKNRRTVNKKLTHAIPWNKVRSALWNFPFADIDEDASEHQNLMHKFFASMCIIMTSLSREDISVILTLCNEQFCRWQVERAARNSFFFLRTSVPFDVGTFGGYHPIRNNLQSTFPVEKPLTYVFELHLPAGWLGDDLRKEIGESLRDGC